MYNVIKRITIIVSCRQFLVRTKSVKPIDKVFDNNFD